MYGRVSGITEKRKKACPAVKYNYQKLLQLVNEWSKRNMKSNEIKQYTPLLIELLKEI